MRGAGVKDTPQQQHDAAPVSSTASPATNGGLVEPRRDQDASSRPSDTGGALVTTDGQLQGEEIKFTYYYST